MKKHTALTIAGSDCSGGAGIQADIKTIEAYDVYAMSVITAVTAQNTLGVQGVYPMSTDCVRAQMESIFTDMIPDAVKIGMLAKRELIHTTAEYLKEVGAKHIVIDPVMISSSGTPLLEEDAVESLGTLLFPMAEVLTPNLPEAEALTGLQISGDENADASCSPGKGNKEDRKKRMEEAAGILSERYHCAVVLKGGHALKDADDLLYLDGSCIWIEGRRIDNPNTHGTGCTFSSAIAAGLAKGMDVEKSVRLAKEYMQRAIGAGLNLGKGSGPLEHSVWDGNWNDSSSGKKQ